MKAVLLLPPRDGGIQYRKLLRQRGWEKLIEHLTTTYSRILNQDRAQTLTKTSRKPRPKSILYGGRRLVIRHNPPTPEELASMQSEAAPHHGDLNAFGLAIRAALQLAHVPEKLHNWKGSAPNPNEYQEILSYLSSSAVKSAPLRPKDIPMRPLVLGRTWATPHLIYGERAPQITLGQFNVITALYRAGSNGLTLKELKSKSGEEVDPNRKLSLVARKFPDTWGRVIIMPGKKGMCGYRIRSEE